MRALKNTEDLGIGLNLPPDCKRVQKADVKYSIQSYTLNSCKHAGDLRPHLFYKEA
jgi:hypothetical protein